MASITHVPLPQHRVLNACKRVGITKPKRVRTCRPGLRSVRAANGDGGASVSSNRRIVVFGGLLAWSGVTARPSQAGPASGSENVASWYELLDSGGVKALDIREGTGSTPQAGDKVAIHHYARLGSKQGWRFDSTYNHKDASGVPEPYVFVVGSGSVIAGLDAAVRSMRVGGVRRVVIPPSQAYQNTTQGPIPPDFFDRQRLYTTVFNPTRLANGEGTTLGTVIFDIQLVRVQEN